MSLLSYMIMVSSALVHAILLKLIESYHLTGSPHVFKRGIINLFCSPHLIYWLTILLDRLCLGMEATSIRQGQVPYGLTAQILDLGLFDICSGVYKGPGPHHCMWFELTVL